MLSSMSRTVVATMAKKQVVFGRAVTLPMSYFHASAIAARATLGEPSPRRPAIRIPKDNTADDEIAKMDFDDYVSKIDTTLTPEQREFVAKIKRMIKGGPKSHPSPYRDVPRPDELGSLANMSPHLADNAEALVDWALSHAPRKAGPRKSRHKKRVAHRIALKQKEHREKIAEVREARERRRQKNLRVLREIQQIKKDAIEINAQREAKLRAKGLLRERLV